MSLTAISLFESARRIFFINSTYILSSKKESKIFLGSGGQNESNIQ